ncbi:MAG: hypothetical protein QGG67_06435 [Gammaproteobacteria bacterium]|nr:hypothetical protein [Gammaproteobacteria bacterium]HJO12509.1 hypothetical protein [Gammaproteobacteria bacterium]
MHKPIRLFVSISFLAVLCSSSLSMAQETGPGVNKNLFAGSWIINEELSDNTDDRVEAAIRADGGRIARSWFRKKEEDRYRGGPADQELYDRISYDDILQITHEEPEFHFEYADGFLRVFYTDGRRQTTGANEFYVGGGRDVSFANWEGDSLLVEARPRDGGYTLETYTLQADGAQLRVEMEINPSSFGTTILLTRIYDRQPETSE